jgi:hypothetical protein
MSICTLLTLERFREILSFSPFHFWQLANPTTPVLSQCVPLLRQYAWQQVDAAGRSEIEEAIAVAEQRLSEWLGYSIAPHYVEDTLDVGSCFIHSSWFYPQATTLKEGKLQKVATETWTNSAAAVLITVSDTDGDGLDDTFTASYTDNGTVTDLGDLKLYFSESEQFIEDDLCRWEIRPVRFKRLDANTIQVTGRYWLLVRPVLYEGVGTVPGYDSSMTGTDSSGAFDPSEPSNFATTVDFYVRTYSAANQVTLELDSGGTVTGYTLPATILDSSTGLIVVGNNCSSLPPCCCSGSTEWWPLAGYSYAPSLRLLPAQRLKVNYRAGVDVKKWETIVARLAMAELARPVCGCKEANRELERWQENAAQVGLMHGGGGGGTSHRIDNSQLGNPLGTRAGAIYAWENVQHLRQYRGINLG